jgi:uncharacterized protein involved in outer membrane biogenesis
MRRMKRVLRWVAGVFICLLLLALALVLSRDRIFKSIAERRIRAETGLEAKIGYLKTGLGSATIALKDLRIYNPPEFGSSVLMDAPELYAELDAEQAASGKLRFKVLRFHLAEVNVVKDKQGRLNLEAIQTSLNTHAPTNGAAKSTPKAKRFEFAGIEKLHLTLGNVNYRDQQQPKNNRQFSLGVQNELVENLKTEEELETWMTAFLVRVAVQEYVKARAERGRSREKGLDLLWKWLGQ